MINEIIKIFSLIFSIVGAIFLGRAQGKRKEQQKQHFEKIELENENLKQIIEVDGNSEPGVIAQFVSTLPIMDSKHIRTFLRDNQPSLDPKSV